MAKRLVAAIKGQAEFRDADFVKPLGDADKAALRQFAACRANYIDYAGIATKDPNVIIRNYNDVSIMFACKGVPSNSPVGISLNLQDGKIATIETHDADLMGRR
jgi:hypothetical protein